MLQQHISFEIIEPNGNRRHNPRMPKKTENYAGPVIQNRLRVLGRSQKWLAEEVGVDPVSVHNWIKKGTIARENVGPCALALGISVAELIGTDARERAQNDEAPPKPRPAGDAATLEWVRPDERALLEMYRLSTQDGKNLVLVVAERAPKLPGQDQTRHVA